MRALLEHLPKSTLSTLVLMLFVLLFIGLLVRLFVIGRQDPKYARIAQMPLQDDSAPPLFPTSHSKEGNGHV